MEEAAAAEQRDGQEAEGGPPEGVVEKEGDVVTTEEEMGGFRIIRAIMREVVDINRVVPRDVKTYFGILLDDNKRKPICRLHLNTSQWHISLFDKDWEEEKVPIGLLDDIYDYADRLKATAAYYG